MYIMILAEQANTDPSSQSRGILYTNILRTKSVTMGFGRKYVIQLQIAIKSHDISLSHMTYYIESHDIF